MHKKSQEAAAHLESVEKEDEDDDDDPNPCKSKELKKSSRTKRDEYSEDEASKLTMNGVIHTHIKGMDGRNQSDCVRLAGNRAQNPIVYPMQSFHAYNSLS